MESLTYFKNLKSSPKKLRMMLNIIKRMSPREALDYLLYAGNEQAAVYHKVIKSAIANATNTLKLKDDMLKFKLLTIEEGHVLKRYKPGSRGMAKPIKRRLSHIKIILVEDKKSAVVKAKADKEVKTKVESKKKTVEKKVKKVSRKAGSANG